MKRYTTLLLAVCVSLTIIAGCYGPFKLTRKLYDWNSSFENKWQREGIFLVLAVLPVYGFSLLADSVFFNLIDFWGGETPLASADGKRTKLVALGDRQAVFSLSQGDRKMRLTLFDRFHPVNSVVIESRDGMTVATDTAGRVLMTARTVADGSVVVQNARGEQVAMHTPGAK